MAKKKPPGEPPPEYPFGQVWPPDREPSGRSKPRHSIANSKPNRLATFTYRLVWSRMLLPLLQWAKGLIKRAFDEMFVFGLKAGILSLILALVGGGWLALSNYSLRHIVDTVIAATSKQHGIETKQPGIETKQLGIETGSITALSKDRAAPTQATQATPPPQQKLAPPISAKRRIQLPKEKPFFDRMIDRIDEALGWKKS